MSHSPAAIWIGSTAAAEVAVLVWAAVLVFHRRGWTFAESAAYGIICTMMLLSFVFQAAMLIQMAYLAPVLEAILIAAAAFVLLRGKPVSLVWSPLYGTLRQHPIPAGSLLVAMGFLFVQAMTAPSGFGQWEALWPVLDLQRWVDFCRTGSGGSFNQTILPHLVLRHHIRFGLGIFGFLAYLAVGFASYALARRYAWPPTAITVSMVVLSAPRLVLHSVTPGVEITAAAAAVFVLLALYRCVEQPSSADLVLMLLGISFCISAGSIGFVLPFILLGLGGLVLYRRHGGRFWWSLAVASRRWLLCAAAPVAVFLQPWMLFCPDPAVGVPTPTAAAWNPDGLTGGLANLLRYLLEALDPTAGIEHLVNAFWGISLSSVVQWLSDALLSPMFHGRGAAVDFHVHWASTPFLSWFGPLAVVLVGPAWLKALLRGPRRLKAVAVALAGYLYLASLLPAWQPGNGRLFMPFWCCAGFMVAFLLPPWRFTRSGRLLLQGMCSALLLYACWQIG